MEELLIVGDNSAIENESRAKNVGEKDTVEKCIQNVDNICLLSFNTERELKEHPQNHSEDIDNLSIL